MNLPTQISNMMQTFTQSIIEHLILRNQVSCFIMAEEKVFRMKRQE